VTATPLIRDDLAEARPYRWQDGVPESGRVLRFDMNTQPRPPAWYARAAARLATVPVQSYPDASYRRLRHALAAYTGFPPEQIIPTAGGDEALTLVALLALRPGDRAYARRPCYDMFANATRLAGGVLADAPDGARLTWICAPHNPTGADATADDAAERPGLVAIDQAYVEFRGTDLSHLVRERENTVVVRTLSKAFALAGARVGYVLAPPSLAAQLDAIRLPAGISAHSAALAELALEHLDEMRAEADRTRRECNRMAAGLAAAGYRPHESRANFVLVDLDEPAAEVARRLLERGMVVRTFADPLLARSIRITPSLPAENDELLAALGAGGAPAPPRHAAAGAGRTAAVERRTRETDVRCRLALDGAGTAVVATGIGFLDHMLTALACHSLAELELACTGDLWVDEHHTVEDSAIVLGQALDRALGARHGILRFGDARAPLDEAICHATVDLGGRGTARVDLPLRGERIGGLPASLVPHFFESFARTGRLAVHLEGRGGDDHHVVEAAFKALARALRAAWTPDPARAGTPSTKGMIE
jgi:histidinol-phosphate/aromatic aminotransferase/cobyric acid decarboxylase-like protein/imidazoleglycerol phosphate dehydratase HisB